VLLVVAHPLQAVIPFLFSLTKKFRSRRVPTVSSFEDRGAGRKRQSAGMGAYVRWKVVESVLLGENI
jgi:hypothetical protein